MEKLSAFRDRELAGSIQEKIREITPSEPVKICHVCGTHEWTITHSGLRTLLPESVSLIAGPGCPVCIVPAREIDEAVWLSLNSTTVVTFGDMYRAPGSEMSLEDAKSRGGEVRVVYSVRDAVEMAGREPENEFVFFAIGFETTAPMNALEIPKCPENLSFLASHRLIPPAMESLAEMEGLDIDGFIAPGHVSTIIGERPYRKFVDRYGVPTVIAGFEPLDVLMARATFFAMPTPEAAIINSSTPPLSTILVSPVIRGIPTSSRASLIEPPPFLSRSMCSPSSNTMEDASATGVAPIMAMSFTVPQTANLPMSPPGKKMGFIAYLSVVKT